MGLSIVSTSSASINLAAPPVATELANGLPADFASLLSGQTLSALIVQPGLSQTIENPGKKSRPDNTDADESAATDPAALVALLGNLAQAPLPHTRADSPLQKTEDSIHSSLSRAPTSVGTAYQTDTNPASSGQPLFSLPEFADQQSAAGASPDKTANLAGDHPAPTAEPTSLATGLAAADPQRHLTAARETTTVNIAHTETWPQQFSEKISWMVRNEQQTAQINITPPQLGPLQITLNLNGDNANVLIASPHAEVRQVIENSLPQLREMLGATGISLGEANVGANLAQQNPNSPFMMANKNQSPLENAILPANDNAPVAGIAAPLHQGRGLVDLFA